MSIDDVDDYTFAEGPEACTDCGYYDNTECSCGDGDSDDNWGYDDTFAEGDRETWEIDEHCGDDDCTMCNADFGCITPCDEQPVNDQ